jgi:amino acid transporter
LLGIAVLLAGGGPEGISVTAFGPKAIFTPGLGIALVFVVASFIGFEATAIFGEEASDPKRTIPRATYIAVVIIAVFYAFATWTVAMHYGPSKIAEQAANNTTTLYFSAVQSRLGPLAGVAMNLLLITSLFACGLSFHNTINRYLYAIGREGLVWSGFARTHRRHHSPYVAGAVQTAFALGVTLLFAIAGQDPYAVVFAWTSTFASIGILVLQIMVGLAVIGFFRRDNRGTGLWHRLIAPLVSIAGLAACLILMIANLSLISGSESWIVNSFPILVIAIGMAGYVFATWLRSAKPAIYENLGRAFG